MLATAIIVFREVLEASLIVGIVMAASRGVPGRSWWIGGGIAGGVVGAAAVAAAADTIAAMAEGIGQELFNAAILLTAVAMLGWHNVWMTSHGREMTVSANRLGAAVRGGAKPLWALAAAVGLAVLREGSEVVLFLYGIAAAGDGPGAMAVGGGLGLAAGIAAGVGLYLGLVRIPLRYLFTVTSWMVLLLAAGMASQGAVFLLQAGLVPALGTTVWDTSFILSDQGLPGRVLRTLIGYTAQPAGIQLVFYLTTVAVIGSLMRFVGGGNATPERAIVRRPSEFPAGE